MRVNKFQVKPSLFPFHSKITKQWALSRSNTEAGASYEWEELETGLFPEITNVCGVPETIIYLNSVLVYIKFEVVNSYDVLKQGGLQYMGFVY